MVSIGCTCESAGDFRVLQSHAVVGDKVICMICRREVGMIPIMETVDKKKRPKKTY